MLATLDLALLAEEELARLGYADAQVTTCFNANMGPATEDQAERHTPQ